MTKPAQITASKSDASDPDVGTAACGCDIVRAVIRGSLLCADAVGLVPEKGATAVIAGVRSALRSLGGSSVLKHASVFEADVESATALAAGMSGRGIRTSIVAGSPLRVQQMAAVSGAPFVVSVCGSTLEPAGGPFFQLVGRNPQHAADLVPLAHRAAELTLRPVVVSVERVDGVSTFSAVDSPNESLVGAFLGSALEEIDSTTLGQLEHVGSRRPRVTNWPRDIARSHLPSAEERILVGRAFNEFSTRTGRVIAPIETSGPPDAEVLIIAAGRLYEQLVSRLDRFDAGVSLLHPTLLAPLPTEQLVQVIARKRAVVIAAASDDLLSYVHEHVAAAIERAVDNGAAAEASEPLRHPESPTMKPGAQPLLRLHRVEAISAVDELREVVEALRPRDKRRTRAATGDEANADGCSLRVLYRSAHSHRSATWLAEHLAVYLSRRVDVLGQPLDQTVQLAVCEAETEHTPRSPADVLIGPGRDFRSLAEDLPLMKNRGVMFIEGDAERAGEIWNTIPPPARELIREKELRLFLFDINSIAGQQMTAEERLDGLFLGGLLRLYSDGVRSVVDPAVIDRILGAVSKNGQVDVEVVVSQGMKGFIELEPADLDVSDALFLETGEESVFRHPETAADETNSDEQLLKRLLRFVNTGVRADRRFEDQGLVPVPLFDYLQSSVASRDYPVIVGGDGGPVSSLPAVIDHLVDSLEDEGDTLTEATRVLRKIETQIGRLAANEPGAGVTQLWNRAVEKVVSSRTAGSGESRIREIVASARQQLDASGEVWPIGRPLAVRLARHAAATAWNTAFDEVRREAEKLHIALADLLRADDAGNSNRGGDPSQASAGKGFEAEVDFRALSKLLEDAGLSEPIPRYKRQRMVTAATALETIPARLAKSLSNGWATGTEPPSDRIAAAIGHVRANLRDSVELGKAIRIARLETAGRYRAEKHDEYFARFRYDDLDERERAATPPYILDLGDAADLDAATVGALLQLLSSDLPIKVIVTTSVVGPEWEEDPSAALATASGVKLGRTAVGLNRAFVLQASLADGTTLRDGLAHGMKQRGPALFSLFQGSTRSMPALDAYLAAAVAVESRLFPTFRVDPDVPGGLATQFGAGMNPHANSAWPSVTVAVAGADGAISELDVRFTYADMLSCDVRFGRHFAIVPTEEWHNAMTPLSTFALLPSKEAANRVPFIWMADRDRTLFRVMVTADVVAAVRRTLADWRIVQEMGGTDSSHVRSQLEQERERLAEEQGEKIAQAQQQLDAELDRAKGELAKEIVANIAAGLLDLRVSGDVLPRAPVERPQETARAAVLDETVTLEEEPAPESPPEPEEETLILDEPYIETVRCTTCNECTQLNPRLFAYNENQQAYLKDLSAGSYRDLVLAAEKCPVRIIHPGKPRDPNEPGLDELRKRAEPFL